MQLQSQQLSTLIFLGPRENERLNSSQNYWLEKLKGLTVIDASDCTTKIPALLSVPHRLPSSATERKIFVQAEAAPDCELKEIEHQKNPVHGVLLYHTKLIRQRKNSKFNQLCNMHKNQTFQLLKPITDKLCKIFKRS